MKKFLFLFSILFSTILSAQQSKNSFTFSDERKNTESKIFGDLKTANVARINSVAQLVDSIYYWHWDINQSTLEAGNRTYLTYDANNNVTMEIWQFFDSNGDWTNNNKFTYTYDANNNEIIRTYYFWNATQGIWENSSVFYSTYDAGNNLMLQESQYWDGSAWQNNAKYVFNRDANHNMILLEQYTWNGTSWSNYFETYNDYDSNNNRIHTLYRHWDGVMWWNDSQNFANYDSDNVLINELFQNPVDTTNWQDYSQRNYTYTNILLTQMQEQIIVNFAWQNNYLEEYIYDGNNNLETTYLSMWQNTGWINQTKYNNTINSNNDITETLQEYWINNNWQNGTQSLYGSDANHFQYANSIKIFDSATGSNIEDADSTHYYYRTLTGVNELNNSDSKISIYPNPTNGKFRVQNSELINSIEIYNVVGEKLFSEAGLNSASTEIDLSKNGKGIFFVLIKSDENSVTKKIIIN